MSQDVFVFVETQDGAIRAVSGQVIAAARPLAEARGGSLCALVVGTGTDSVATEAANLGADRVLVVDDPALETYTTEAYTAAVVGAIRAREGAVLAIGNTAIGKDLAPRVAQRLDLAMVSDVVGVESTEGNPQFRRPIYAARAYRIVEVLQPDYVISVRANSFPSAEPTAAPVEIEKLDVAVDASGFRTKVKEIIERDKGQVDLTEADVVVSGGMGVKGPEGFDTLRPLAEALDAAVGSSRAAVLAEYIHPSHQVGQTGKTVSPNLYIACGISGAIQHQAGMSTSKCVVAINTDADAPIFEIADYGIVADLFEVVPALTEEVKKLKGA